MCTGCWACCDSSEHNVTKLLSISNYYDLIKRGIDDIWKYIYIFTMTTFIAKTFLHVRRKINNNSDGMVIFSNRRKKTRK